MMRRRWFLLVLLTAAAIGCRHKNSASITLDDNARTVLAEIAALEAQKDVTCWTSFRQLDWFIAEAGYSEFATLAKIAAVRRLARAAWAKAAIHAKNNSVTVSDFEATTTLPTIALPADKKTELVAFANDVGLKNYTDYQKTAEHWRVVLAVVHDEIYRGGTRRLPPMEPAALRWLADAATVLSLDLLKKSGAAARAAKHPLVEGQDVQAAYAEIASAQGLSNVPDAHVLLGPAEVVERLQPLTRLLIDGKAKALQSFNKTSDRLTSDLNRVSRIPLTDDAVESLRLALQSFTHFVSAGFEPMRADNYLSDGSFARSALPRLAYLDEVRTQNVLEQLFPHEMMANGDVVVRFEPNPGPIVKVERRPFEIRLLDHEMNGVRDTAIHWIVMRNVWNEKPFAMDPFAAEYLSEVVSMLMTLYIRRGEAIARELGKDRIDGEVAARVRDRSFVMVPPHRASTATWSEERKLKKAALLASYPAELFKDISAQSGLSTKGSGGTDLGNLEGHVEPANVEGHGIQGHVAPDLENVSGHFDIQQIMGGGIAVGDLDRDGFADLYLAGAGGGRLYLNRGKVAPGRFADVTEEWGLPTDIEDGHGALFFDLDGDDDHDLLVVRSEQSSMIFRNDGAKLTDISSELGFRTHRGAHVASVFDHDEDGDLDIYIGYYGNHDSNTGKSRERSLPSLDGRNGSPNQLWQQDDGMLIEVGEKAGVADVGWTLALGTFDHDMDGHLDLYMANDFGPNALYRNRGDGTFENVTEATHTGDRGSGMNVDFSDYNRDGQWDIYVTNIDMFSKRIKVVFPRDESTISIDESLVRAFQYLSGNKLYVSAPGDRPPYRAEEGARFEPGDRGWGWDAAFFDYDNDADDDLYLTNGWVDGSYAGNQKNQMFLLDEGTFYLGPAGSAEAFAGNTRSAAAIDLDNDGDIDLVTNNFRQPPVVLENTFRGPGHWIQLRLRGKDRNTDAIGALVKITAGNTTILRQVSCGRGYLSQASPVISAGVGGATAVKVTVRWPDGIEKSFEGLALDRRHTLDPR